MKKIIFALLLAVVSLSAKAQFEYGTAYLNTSLTGLSMSYNSNTKFTLGIDFTGGFFVDDAWMVYGRAGYNHPRKYDDQFNIGAGARYYIVQNGLYLGLGAKYQYDNAKSDNYRHQAHNLYVTPEVGYCFYLNQYVSIEPAVYYDISVNHFSDFSTVGLRLGFGYYF